jgi:cytochrome b561
MSLFAERRRLADAASPVQSYDRVLKTIHWVSLLLVTAAYAAVWASHVAASAERHAALVQLHRSLGVTVFALTLLRLGWRCRARLPELPAELPRLQQAAARATEWLLYALLVVQPLLGALNTNARGRRIEFYFLGALPPVIGPDKALAREAMMAHEFVAYLLLAIIGLHSAAALFHHFIRRDGVLEAMLLGRRH